jgi:O-antigen ligase
MTRTDLNKISLYLFYVFLIIIFIQPFVSETTYPVLGGYIQISLLAATLLRLLTDEKSGIMTTSLGKVLLLYIFSAAISLFYSINLRSGIHHIYQIIPLLSVFIFTSNLDKKQAQKLLFIIITSALILSAYGIYQYIWGFEHTKKYVNLGLKSVLETRYAREILLTRRAIAMFFSPNMFACYLSMIIPLCSGLLLDKAKNKKTLIFLAICLALAFTSLLLTKSMAGWLSLSFGAIVFFVLAKGISRRITLISAIALLIITGALLLSRYNMFFDPANQQNTLSQRLSFFKNTIEIIKDFPVKGIGAGNLGNIYLKYKGFIGNETRFSHNLFLQTWAETGLPGLTAVFLLVLSFFRTSFKIRKNFVNIGIISSCCVFIINNLMDFSYYIPQVSFIWWINLGIISKEAASPDKRSGYMIRPLVILMIAAAISLNTRSLIALTYFMKGDIKKAAAIEPYNDIYHSAMGNYEKAIKLNPYFPFYRRDLGLLYLKKGMREKAVIELEKASELYPGSARLHQLLFDIYNKTGEFDKADKEKIKLEEYRSEYSGYFIR